VSNCSHAPECTAKTLRQVLEVPFYSPKLKIEKIKKWERRDLVFERVRFQGRYREWIPAMLVYSKLAFFQPLPAIICMPGIPGKKEDLLQTSALLPLWVDKGFFLISIDRPYYGERGGDMLQAIKNKGLLKVWGESVYDIIRTLDYLESRPEVDPKRIGILGQSMGGMEALITGSLDPRLKVIVSASGQMSWPSIFATGAWRQIFSGLPLTKQLQGKSVAGNNALKAFEITYPGFSQVDAAKMIALLAPRPLLLIGGELDSVIPKEALNYTYNLGLKAYTAKNSKDHLAKFIEPQIGHSFSPAMQEKALGWFVAWFKDHNLIRLDEEN
jgi:predicted esterase